MGVGGCGVDWIGGGFWEGGGRTLGFGGHAVGVGELGALGFKGAHGGGVGSASWGC